ncbi:MAG: hypothetical protein RA161_01720 [Arsenophonus sp.]|nr:MAG: hypothetical protein RA161_01720 [Arsenophonus sp.]
MKFLTFKKKIKKNKFVKKIYPYLSLIRINNPTGIFLLLWPTYWALWLSSNGMPEKKKLLYLLLVVF